MQVILVREGLGRLFNLNKFRLFIGLVNFHSEEKKDKEGEDLGCTIANAKDGDDLGVGHVEALSLNRHIKNIDGLLTG